AMAELLNKGLDWAISQETADVPGRTPEESQAILQAIQELSPSESGPIEKIQVSGSLVRGRLPKVSLSPATRKRVRERLEQLSISRAQDSPVTVFAIGRVDAVDRGAN